MPWRRTRRRGHQDTEISLRLRRRLGTHDRDRAAHRSRVRRTLPRLIEASGRCPPEDCGGPWGYAELLEAIADPKHERHDELSEWIGDEFNPDAVEADWLTEEVAALAKRWSRKPATQRRR